MLSAPDPPIPRLPSHGSGSRGARDAPEKMSMSKTNIWDRCGRPDIGREIEARGLTGYVATGVAGDVVWALTRPGVVTAEVSARLKAAFADLLPEAPGKPYKVRTYEAWRMAFYGVLHIGGCAAWIAEQRGVYAYGPVSKVISARAVHVAWEAMARIAAGVVGMSRTIGEAEHQECLAVCAEYCFERDLVLAAHANGGAR